MSYEIKFPPVPAPYDECPYILVEYARKTVQLNKMLWIEQEAAGWIEAGKQIQQEDSHPTTDNVLNACITYVLHSDADFEGMNPALVDYFKKVVDPKIVEVSHTIENSFPTLVTCQDCGGAGEKFGGFPCWSCEGSGQV